MKNFQKFLYALLGASILFSGTIFAINVTVPSAPKAGYFLVSTSTGAYIATTTDPAHFGSIYATSTNATSTFIGNVLISSTGDPSFGFNAWNELNVVDNQAAGPVQINVVNRNTGVSGGEGIFLGNANATNAGYSSTYYSGLFQAGSAFGLYPGVLPNDMVVVTSDSNLRFAALSTKIASSTMTWSVGPGFTSANYDMTLLPTTNGKGFLGISTTTPKFPLTVSATNTPQIAIESNDADNWWVMRSIGNIFALATASPTTWATSTASVFTIDANGFPYFTSLSGTGCAQFTAAGKLTNTGSACGSGGSGTVSSGLAGQLGYYNTTGTTIVGTSTNPLYVDALVATSTTLDTYFYDTVRFPNLGANGIVKTTQTTNRLSMAVAGTDYLIGGGTSGNCANWGSTNSVGDLGSPCGTVTSVAPGTGLGGGTITTSGKLSLLSYIATSSAETNGNLAYWTTGAGTPAKLGTVATTTLTGTAPIAFSQPVFVIGGSASIITCATATGLLPGCVSAANWNTFNNKVGTSSSETSGQIPYWSSTSATPPTLNGGVSGFTFDGTRLNVNYASSSLYASFQVASSSTLFAGQFTISTTTAGCAAFSNTGVLNSTGTTCGSSITGTTGQVTYLSGTNTAVGTSTIFISTNGFVGVGTTSPPSLLTISASSTQLVSVNPVLLLGTSTLSSASANGTYIGANSPTGFTGDYLHFQNAGTVAFKVSNSTNGLILLGTTTNSVVPGKLVIATTTTAQITLQGNPADLPFNIRSIGSNFYIATSSATSQATSTTPDMRIDANGAVYFPSTTIQGAAATDYWCYDSNAQLIRVSATCTVSARRFKTDIQPLTVGLTDLLKLNPVSYLKKDPMDVMDSHMQMGLIADDVASSSPLLNEMLVTYVGGGTSGEVQGFRYDQFTALLTQSIKDLNTKVENMKISKVARSAEENWQWIAIGLLVLWNLYLTLKKRE